MPGRVSPIKDADRAHGDTDPVATATVPVDCSLAAVDPQLLWWFDSSPNVMSGMSAAHLLLLLKVRIDGQASHSSYNYSQARI